MNSFPKVVFILCALTLSMNGKVLATDLMQQLTFLRQLEHSGQWEQAGQGYMALINPMPGLPQDVRIAAGRRAVACMTIAADEEINQSRSLHQRCNRQLRECYEAMSKLEPGNSVWPFLLSQEYSAEGQYPPAVEQAKLALAKGGSPSMKSKEQTLFEYVSRGQKVQTAYDTKRGLMFNKIMRGTGHYNYSNSVVTPSSSYQPQGDSIAEQNRHWNEGVAKQNAWGSGDSGALGRMNNGTPTDQDKSRYGGGW